MAVDTLEMLYAIKFFSDRREEGLTPETYSKLVSDIKAYFPEIDCIESSRTPDDIATLHYVEQGSRLDILYSGSGLKHFIDILLKITVSRANVILLDEPEMGLHPDLQRQLIGFFEKLVKDKGIQILMATHSPIFLSQFDVITPYRVSRNSNGRRSVMRVPSDAVETVLSDLGIRPSDIFNRDMCLLVEGASDVAYFEHVLHTLYEAEFRGVSVGVIQYAGSAAEGIVSGGIGLKNVVAVQQNTFWIRDRDAPPTEDPSSNSTRFKNAIEKHGLSCHILERREIEYYYPGNLVVAAQQGDAAKVEAAKCILNGNQKAKFREAAEKKHVCVPKGKCLRELLKKHLKEKYQLSNEIRGLIEGQLLTMKRKVLGDAQPS